MLRRLISTPHRAGVPPAQVRSASFGDSGATIEQIAALLVGGALAWGGVRRGSPLGLLLAMTGGFLAYRGLTSGRPISSLPTAMGAPYPGGVTVRRAVTIGRPREEVFAHWRPLQNLPRIMSHLESVTPLEGNRSHWVALGPSGMNVEWDAELVEEIPGQRIVWRSLPGALIHNAGTILFKEAPGGRGTELHVHLEYAPAGGVAGQAIARLFEEVTAETIQNELRRFKQMMEAGEVATTEGQPSGREP